MAPSELTLEKMLRTPLLPIGIVAEQLDARAQMFFRLSS
jgi:hypothetical protein